MRKQHETMVTKSEQWAMVSDVLRTGKLPEWWIDLVEGLPTAHKRGSWAYHSRKFARFVRTGTPEYSMFTKGNSKLPFWAFSSLPAFTCPGAGECLNFCYSFNAWRYPAALFRQLQNALLIRWQSEHLTNAFKALPYGQTVRLYVDGDLDTNKTLEFWFDLLNTRPDLQAYGYSKSWEIFLAHHFINGLEFPSNYMLNLSSGSKYGPAVRKQMQKLPITRGEFVALKASHKMPNRETDPAKWHKWAVELKTTAKAKGYEKAFVCPGKCWACLPNGKHACGSDSFRGVPILIGIH